MRQLYRCDFFVSASFVEQGIPWECEDDFWVEESIVVRITTPYTVDNKKLQTKSRRNQERPLKKLLDVRNTNGSTSGPVPWELHHDDDDDDDDDDDGGGGDDEYVDIYFFSFNFPVIWLVG